ncbi:MAG: response regulator [Deltaproteobacteria bacterium]|nr:response regulator [Deltaproteobacteria bacterium]
MAETSVLIIDDEKENVRYLTTILEENGFREIYSAFDGEEGLKKVKETSPGLILLDLRMPKKSGISVFNELKKSPDNQDIPVIILTGEGGFLKHLAELREFHEDGEGLEGKPTEEILSRFIAARPDAFLEKPIEPEPLMATIRQVLITLEEVQEKRCNEVNNLRSQKLLSGVVFKGNSFESDETSRNHLSAVAAKLAAPNATLPDNFGWRTSDNKDIPMTKEDVLAFQGAITDWVYNLYDASWKHKAAIDALTNIEDAEDYDMTPAVYCVYVPPL